MKSLTFPNGDRMPILGLGTWQSEPGAVQAAVREAIRLGYRHIDCAMAYGNEAEIGQAIRDAIAAGDVRRQDIWVTSKLWSNAHGRDNVEAALRQSLRNFDLDYLDLYLIHWPIPLKPGAGFPLTAADFEPPERVPVHSTWAGMEAAVAAGLTRHIGVSNFSVRKLRELLPRCRIRVELNQVELHPLLQQPELVKYCAAEGIHLMAWSPLGSAGRPALVSRPDAPVLLEDPVIRSIAAGHGCTPAQVLLAWHVQRGIAAIPKSVSPSRLRENLAAAGIELGRADLDRIAGLDRNYRMIDGSFWVVEGSPWTLQSIWDGP